MLSIINTKLQSTINDEKLSLDSHLEELRKRHMVELEELSRQHSKFKGREK